MGRADHDPDAFAEELAALKRRGCAVLVVNPPSGRQRCEALLGEDGRERILVDTGDNASDPSGDHDVVDAGKPGVRSASASSAPSQAGSLAGVRDLDEIARDLRHRIDRHAEGGLEPGELRVCFGNAETLAAREEEAIERFFEDVSARVKEVGGMGHAHLPVTSPVRDWIEPVFDVTVEVRSGPDGRQQRWLLHEAGLDSGWLAIEDTGPG
ncbi:MAG: hypothetical protein ABEH66_01460 [Halobacteriales archaeon]